MNTEKLTIDPAAQPPQNNYKLLIGSVVPRPIAFVSTVSPNGVRNLAPFSFFNAVCGNPPVVLFASGVRHPPKDTLANVRETGEFVVNIVTEEIAERMNLTSGEYPAAVDEFEVSKLTPVPSDLVKPPCVLESPVNMECKLLQIVEVSTNVLGGSLVIGEVIRFHIDPAITSNFRIDAEKLRAIGRMGGNEYTRTRCRFEMIRPQV
ncbi:MAG TPA: flavin reductase family protein [Bryobacteraceae bacterium]|jgi:flavin reductase (DIM6/NTAB) family NADH-FMN oxidoreductase RutF